jgi:hypothetical protein
MVGYAWNTIRCTLIAARARPVPQGLRAVTVREVRIHAHDRRSYASHVRHAVLTVGIVRPLPGCTLLGDVDARPRRPISRSPALDRHHSCSNVDANHMVVTMLNHCDYACNSVIEAASLVVLKCRPCNSCFFSHFSSHSSARNSFNPASSAVKVELLNRA